MNDSSIIKGNQQSDFIFPYTIKPSFVPIIEFWRKVANDKQHSQAQFAIELLKKVEKIPALIFILLLSVIRRDLLKRNSLTGKEMFSEVLHSIRSLFQLPDLELGIGIYSEAKDIVENFGDAEGYSSNC